MDLMINGHLTDQQIETVAETLSFMMVEQVFETRERWLGINNE